MDITAGHRGSKVQMAGGDLPGEKPRGVGKVLGKASDHPWGLKVRWADGTTESIHIEDLEFVDA